MALLSMIGLALFAVLRGTFRATERVITEHRATAHRDTATTPPAPFDTKPPPPLTAPDMAMGTAGASTSVPQWFQDETTKLPAERKRVSITIYTASWCRYCKAAKAWLNAHEQPYFERDIDADPEARVRMQKLNPKGSLPTINVDDEIIIGFSAAGLGQAIDLAARRHLAHPLQ